MAYQHMEFWVVSSTAYGVLVIRCYRLSSATCFRSGKIHNTCICYSYGTAHEKFCIHGAC